jgi:Secretion system C-terminal sorting domain
MKQFFTFAVFVLLFLNVSNAQWMYLTPPDIHYFGNYLISHNGDLYFANNKDIWKTSDGGGSWSNLTNGFITNSGNSNLYIQFAGNNIFVASTLLAVFMSPDNGSTWQIDTVGLEESYSTTIMYCDGTTIFVSEAYPTYGLYKKTAAPGPWTRINNNSIGTSFQTQVLGITKIGSDFYACTRNGTYVSTDNGSTWTEKTNSNYPGLVDLVTSNQIINIGSDLFLATADGLYKSTDQAESWVRIDQGFATWDLFGVAAIQCVYTDGSDLYASMIHDDSAYVSSDAGTTWSDISDGNALNHHITSFAMFNGHLFATQFGTADTSLLRYGSATGVDRENAAIPEKFELSQNYPNPFNPTTKIDFSVPGKTFVSLKVFDVLGKEIADLVHKELPGGKYTVDFNATHLASGVYFYRLNTNSITRINKMVLLR